MAGFAWRLGALPVVVVTAGLLCVPVHRASAQDPVSPTTDASAGSSLQTPTQGPQAPKNDSSVPTETTAIDGASGPPSPGEVPDVPTNVPSATTDPGAATSGELSNETPADAGSEAAGEAAVAPGSGEIAPDLLSSDDADIEPKSPPPPVLRPQVSTEEAEEAALRREFETRHRPASNPGRINLAVRLMFANAGGADRIGGRMGGAQVDVGQAWNSIGYGLTASAWGGRVFLPRETGSEMNALFGVGPTLSLGRRALIQRGFLDLRAGYDIFYGVVNERRDGPAIVATQSGPGDAVLVQADNLVPHGPRATLSMGFFSLNSTYRRFVHGVGATIGYQGLVGSIRGELPFTHMLTLGLAYWMG